ncbi:MAG TPA: V-type ATPase 116kDa subunit family protein [Thermoplasmata archaeon]|nr:V-type ATPase 116kDa subunit family protein [Thermoplasmata archaeon]
MPFLRPLPMEKIGVVGLKDDRERALTVLHDLGVIQVEPIRKEALDVFGPDRGPEVQRAVAEQLVRLRGLLHALPRVPISESPRRFEDVNELLRIAKTVTVDAEVGQLTREEDQLLTDTTSTDEAIDLLRKIAFYPDRLELLSAASVLAFFGEVDSDDFGEFRAALDGVPDLLVLEHRLPKAVRVLVVGRRDKVEQITRVAQEQGVRLTAVPRLDGTVGDAIPRLEAHRTETQARLAEIRARLAGIAGEWYAELAALEEGLTIENRKLELVPRLAAGETVFALEGWIPKARRAALERDLAGALDQRVVTYSVATKEEPPTIMQNPPGVRWYEFFIRFYSLPQATEWDPTWVFALVFPIFFGLMLGDIGYGVTILLVCLWMIRGFPGGAKLPKGPKNFVKRIMGPQSMRSLAYALVPGCLIAIAVGFLDNSIFGFALLPSYTAPLAVDANGLRHSVPFLLYLAGYIGLAMVCLGFFLGALKEYFHHHVRAAIGKVGGILFALGLADFGLQFIHLGTGIGAALTAGSLAVVFGIVGVASGAILLVVGEGAMLGGMALIETLSHILSYTRLVGILLASVILALVINGIAWGPYQTPTGLIAQGAIGFVAGVVLIVFGQGFNVILGVFEPGIQGARLIFVEHFSKFYGGNGRPFRPLGTRRVRTVATHAPLPPEAAAN